MPSTSAKQHRFMEAIAHNSAFAKKAGVSQSVGKDFSAADKGKKFAGGGAATQKINRQDTQHGAMDMPFKSLKKFTGMKAGGKVRRFDEGGFTAAETKWLGGADRTDPYILARMRNEVREPAPVEERGIGRKTPAPVEERDISRVNSSGKEPNSDPTPVSSPAVEVSQNTETSTPSVTSTPRVTYTPKATTVAKKPTAYTSAQDARGYLEGAHPKKPTAKPKVDAEDDDFAKKIKKDKADDEASASNIVDRSVALASAIPFAGPAARFSSKAFKAFKAFQSRRGAMATKNAAGKVKPNAGKPEDFNKLSQAERDRVAGRNRNVKDESGDRTGLREDESMKKGGKVGMKKPNPFMEMIAKKKEKAEGESPSFQKKEGKKGEKAEMKFAKGGMAKYAKGGGIESKGKTVGKVIRMASGGSVGSASRRADGIAQRGKTRL